MDRSRVRGWLRVLGRLVIGECEVQTNARIGVVGEGQLVLIDSLVVPAHADQRSAKIRAQLRCLGVHGEKDIVIANRFVELALLVKRERLLQKILRRLLGLAEDGAHAEGGHRQDETSNSRVVPVYQKREKRGSIWLPRWVLEQQLFLEVELERELDAAVAVQVVGVTEVLVAKSAGLGKRERQVVVAARRVEGGQRVVQEVVGGDAELNLLGLRDHEKFLNSERSFVKKAGPLI